MSNGHNHAMVSKGVDELIARLRDEGIADGERQASDIITEAKQQAQQIIALAKSEAEQLKKNAQAQASEYKAAGESAVQTAMRDMVLQLKLDLTREFSGDLQRLVSHQLQQPEILKEMILELVGRVARDTNIHRESKIEVILPENVIGLDELRNNPDALGSGQLMEFVFGLTRDMLQDGIEFKVDERREMSGGIRVKLVEQNLELDLTEQAVAAILLQHLQPRFRAILEGVVR